MNSVANGKITLETPFRKVYVQPAAGDAGGALGTALVASCRTGSLKSRFRMAHAYWDPEFRDADFEALIANVEPLSKRSAFRSLAARTLGLCVQMLRNRLPRGRWSASSRVAWNGVPRHWATDPSSAILSGET